MQSHSAWFSTPFGTPLILPGVQGRDLCRYGRGGRRPESVEDSPSIPPRSVRTSEYPRQYSPRDRGSRSSCLSIRASRRAKLVAITKTTRITAVILVVLVIATS